MDIVNLSAPTIMHSDLNSISTSGPKMIFGDFLDTERRWGAKLAGRQGAGGHRDDGMGARGLTRRFPGNTAPSCLGRAVQPRSSQRMRI